MRLVYLIGIVRLVQSLIATVGPCALESTTRVQRKALPPYWHTSGLSTRGKGRRSSLNFKLQMLHVAMQLPFKGTGFLGRLLDKQVVVFAVLFCFLPCRSQRNRAVQLQYQQHLYIPRYFNKSVVFLTCWRAGNPEKAPSCKLQGAKLQCFELQASRAMRAFKPS